MDEVAVFERRLGDWLAGATECNPACGCCQRRRRHSGAEVLLAWTLLDRDDRLRFLDEHAEDSYVQALHGLVGLTR